MNNLNEDREKAKEKVLEALLEYVGACHVDDITNKIQADDGLEVSESFMQELDLRIRKLIFQYNIKSSIRRIRKMTVNVFPKLAMFFFVVIISLSIMLTSVDAFRVKVLNFIINVQKEYTSISLKEKDPDVSQKDTLKEWSGAYLPSYVPEGFQISKMNSLLLAKIVHYSNEDGQVIVFQQYKGESSDMRIDTENAEVEKISINGIEGLYVKKGKNSTIVWYNDHFTFSLMSDLDENELVKMAQSTVIVE